MSGYYLTITADMKVEIEKFPAKMYEAIQLWQRFCGGNIEEVTPFGVRGKYKIFTNESAAFNDDFKTNVIASRLYGVEKHGQCINGNICLVGVTWDSLAKCEKIVGLTTKQVNYLLNKIIGFMTFTPDDAELSVWEDEDDA